MKRYLLGLLLLAVQLNCAHKEVNSVKTTGITVPKSDGTFIQSYLVRDWTDERWQREFAALKEAGMQYLILGSTLNTDNDGKTYAIFPTSLPGVTNRYGNDIVENCLRNAKAAGMKVFLGLNFDEKWWQANFTLEWITAQMELGNKLAGELITRYKSRYKETMYGWYWVWEVDNLHTTTAQSQTLLAKALNVNLDYLNKETPDMPFMLCPFFNHRLGTAQESATIWTNVFRQTNFKKGDIFAPQDCVGAGGLTISVLGEWFAALKKAVDTKPGLQFWVDTETFDQRFWTSATLDRFVKQMEIVKPYVSNYITFAYSHYYSPWKDNPQFHKDYLYYLKNGKLPDTEVSADIQNADLITLTDLSKEFVWSVRSGSEANVAGYRLYLNDELYAEWQYKPGAQKDMRVKIAANSLRETNRFFVTPYSASGKEGAGKRITAGR